MRGRPGKQRELPAWARESVDIRIPPLSPLRGVSREWAWSGATGRGIRVAVIDSGVEFDHPGLHDSVDPKSSAALAAGADGGLTAVPGIHDDDYGHGTACAGIIHSIAPEARISSVKVLGKACSGRADALVRGLAWAIETGCDVINVSLGTTRLDWQVALYELCDDAYFDGRLVVTAANNIAERSYPSLFASVVSVACNGATDALRFHYNPNPPTEYLARGVDVDVCWRDARYAKATGNSFAAAHVAGIAALILSKHPDLRPFDLKAVMRATASNSLEAASAGRLSTQMGRRSSAFSGRPTLAGRFPQDASHSPLSESPSVDRSP